MTQETAPALYPRPFPVKLFLRPNTEHEVALEALVGSLTTDQPRPATIERRASRGGRYVCITVTFVARDAEHARHVGQTLAAASGVIMAL